MSKKMSLFSTLAILISSCENADFKEFSALGDLRIVGVEASTPEIDGTNTGSVSITLTPFLSDIKAAGRVINVNVVSCLDATFAQTGLLSCTAPTTEAYPNSNTFDTATLAASSYTGPMSSLTITINNPASLISSFSAQLRYNGIPFYVLFTLTSGSDQLNFVKRLKITDRGVLNQNPVIDNVSLGGSPISTAPSSSGSLALTFTASGSPESFQEYTSDGSLVTETESYLISWFSSAGKVKPARVLTTQTSQLTTTTQAVLIGVVRDRRGGTDVRVFTP